MNDPRCEHCADSGIVLDPPHWDPCSCRAGVELVDELDRGREQIANGEYVRWEDIKRTDDRLQRMAAGYFG